MKLFKCRLVLQGRTDLGAFGRVRDWHFADRGALRGLALLDRPMHLLARVALVGRVLLIDFVVDVRLQCQRAGSCFDQPGAESLLMLRHLEHGGRRRSRDVNVVSTGRLVMR